MGIAARPPRHPLAATSRPAQQRARRVWDELRTSRPEGTGFSLTLVDKGHHIWAQPVGAQGRVEAFLAVGKPDAPSQLDRIVAGHALSLFAIELAKSRAVAEAERRLQGDFFDALASGTLPPQEAIRGLTRFGFDRGSNVLAVGDRGRRPQRRGARPRGGRPPVACGRAYLISRNEVAVHVLMAAEPPPELGALRACSPSASATCGSAPGAPSPPTMWIAACERHATRWQVCRLEAGDRRASKTSGRTGCSCR